MSRHRNRCPHPAATAYPATRAGATSNHLATSARGAPDRHASSAARIAHRGRGPRAEPAKYSRTNVGERCARRPIHGEGHPSLVQLLDHRPQLRLDPPQQAQHVSSLLNRDRPRPDPHTACHRPTHHQRALRNLRYTRSAARHQPRRRNTNSRHEPSLLMQPKCSWPPHVKPRTTPSATTCSGGRRDWGSEDAAKTRFSGSRCDAAIRPVMDRGATVRSLRICVGCTSAGYWIRFSTLVQPAQPRSARRARS